MQGIADPRQRIGLVHAQRTGRREATAPCLSIRRSLSPTGQLHNLPLTVQPPPQLNGDMPLCSLVQHFSSLSFSPLLLPTSSPSAPLCSSSFTGRNTLLPRSSSSPQSQPPPGASLRIEKNTIHTASLQSSPFAPPTSLPASSGFKFRPALRSGKTKLIGLHRFFCHTPNRHNWQYSVDIHRRGSCTSWSVHSLTAPPA